MEAWQEVRESLSHKGFEPITSSGDDVYLGIVKVGKIDVTLEIIVPDYDFLDQPIVRIENREQLPKQLLAHIQTDGSLCYADQATFLLDRCQPARSVLGVIEQAKNTLQSLLHGNPTQEIIAELAAYWGGSPYCLIDNPYSMERAVFGRVKFLDNKVIAICGMNAKRLQKWAKNTFAVFEESFSLPVVQCTKDIIPPPKAQMNLQEAINWVQPQVSSRIDIRGILRPEGKAAPGLLIVGQNAILGFRAIANPIINRAIERGFRKASIPDLWFKNAPSLEIEPLRCELGAHREITARNLDGMSPLAGKKIALIGCGTIGGYLARSLSQLGAGQDDDFLLIDPDDLAPGNLGRHALGIRFVGRNKATSVAEWLKADFPDISVSGKPMVAQKVFDRFRSYDLIIDATGDEQFSNALNAFALSKRKNESDFPPILFTMIFGNGLAAQSYFANWKAGSACYRCLKPVFDGDWRYSPVKNGATVADMAVRPCTQGSFVPFAVSATMACVSLATQHVIDVCSSHYQFDLRTTVVDRQKARDIPFRNVSASPKCPACHTDG